MKYKIYRENIMSKYKEIFKLKEMLEKAEIPYIFFDRFEENRKLMKNNEYLNEYLKDKEYYQILLFNDFREVMKHYNTYKVFDNEKRIISIVQGYGTYGEEDDLLEIMGLLTEEEEKIDSVTGYLTAEDVFNRIVKDFKDKSES